MRQIAVGSLKAYDSNSFRKSLRKDGIKPVIPGRSNRKKRVRHDKQAYKDRNVIERCYCRLKDFRRIATRYDKLARNYFSALRLVAAVAFWLWSCAVSAFGITWRACRHPDDDGKP
ncbi:transposase [Bradyrhizobium liaoningense]|nr:transposase [Bradyrhizobium liaoningense]MBR1000450.1 transposase [Bradyrhizobium liaoningense]MBR1066963.1 transposase [Bradyrhizobium liaoningense]